jgi:hypothetical protein
LLKAKRRKEGIKEGNSKKGENSERSKYHKKKGGKIDRKIGPREES